MAQSWLTRGAVTAERNRLRMQKTGETFSGARLWTDEDIATAKRLYPDCKAIAKKLHRSYRAVRSKCQALKLTPTRHAWTGLEIAKLRRLFPAGTCDELREAFPFATLMTIGAVARYHGFKRNRKPYVPTGNEALDQIRQRCFELGYTMRDVDAMSRTKRFFSKARWHKPKGRGDRAIGRAIRALDGKVSAQWNE